MTDIETELVQRIISDDVCLEKILAANSNEEIKKVFGEKGFYLTSKQVEKIKEVFRDQLVKLKLNKIENEENIENISGGKNYENAAFKGGGYGGAYGMWAGACLGALAGVVDTGFQLKKGRLDSSWDAIKNILKFSISTGLIASAASAATGSVASVASESLKQTKN